MNHIYRVLFNRKLGLWQVASERSRGCKKSHRQGAKVAAALLFLGASSTAWAQGALTATGYLDPELPADHNGMWELQRLLYIGFNGQNGTLTVGNGGKVLYRASINGISVGWGADGELIVEGEGSRVDIISGWLHIATNSSGHGRVKVKDGAVLTAREVRVTGSGNSGELSISGEGARVEAKEVLDAVVSNRNNSGKVLITDGGVLTSKSSLVGLGNYGGMFRAEIQGVGSEWITEENLAVKAGRSRDSSTVVIQNGGKLTAGTLSLEKGYTNNASHFSSIYIGGGSTQASDAVGAGLLSVSSIDFGEAVNADVVLNHTNTDYLFSARLESKGQGGKEGGHQLKQVAGTTTLTANSSGFQGRTTVSGGTLIVQNKLGGSAEVTGGTLQYGDGINGAANTLQGDLRVSGQGSTLSIQQSASLSLGGGVELADDTNLRLAISPNKPLITANAVRIGHGTALHVDASRLGLSSDLISTSRGIEGDFSSIHVSDYKQGPKDYKTLNTRKSDEGLLYQAFEGLSWTANNNLAHGTFTVDDSYVFSYPALKDEKGNANWDGKTLTKKGGGFLQLDGDNTYSGGTILEAGELWVTKDQNLGVSSGSITLDGGTLEALESFDSGRTVHVNKNSGISVDHQKTLHLTGALIGSGVLTKRESGTLVLSGNNADFTGSTVVSKGRLVVLGTAGDKAEVLGGATLQYGDGAQGAANALKADLAVKDKNSTLSVQGAATLAVQGKVDLAKNTKLALGVSANGTSLQADSLTLGAGVSFTLSGIYTPSKTDTVLINTLNGISGDFSSISVGGFVGTVDYLTLNTRKSEDGTQYLASYDLSWTANNNLRTGTFTLTNATDEFGVGVNLTDQAANKDTGWDGKTLTKAGAGILVLTGDNSYTGGTIVQGGKVSVSSDANLGAAGSSVVLEGGGLATTESFASARNVTLNKTGHMDVAANTKLDWQGAITGAGGLTKSGTGTLVLGSANSYAGVTTLAAGTVQINADSALGTATSVIVDGGGLASTASFSSMRTMALNQTGHMDVAANTELNWQGAISGAGGLTKTGAGTLVLDRANSYAGVTTLTAGTVQIDADSALGTANSVAFSGGGLATTASFTSARDFNLNKAGTIDVATGTTLGVTGTVAGAGDLRKTGQGTLQLTNTANAYGNTLVQEGTVEASSASISGNIANAGTVILNEAADVSFTGHLLALNNQAGQMIKQGQGHLTLAGQSALDWHIEAGQVSSAAERFTGNAEIDAGASLALNQAVAAHYAGQLSGAGSLLKQGQGLLQLTGDSSAFTGNVNIEAGRLAINGKLGGSQTVGNGAFLGGNGTIGSGAGSTLTVAQGGTLSPGNSIGTLTIDGDLALQAGSRFEVEVDPQSADADLVHVTGNASLAGGVAHIGENGNYNLRSTYTILAVAGSLSGRFDTVQSDFAFLTPELHYDYGAGNVQLVLLRNSTSFASLAETSNQRATATAIDSMGVSAEHAVYDAIAQLPNDAVLMQSSLNALSGEIHASTKTALIDDSRFIRDAATDRLRGAFGAAGSSASPVLANQQVVNANTASTAAWLQLFGNWGHSDSNGNAHKLKRRTNGFMLGADTGVGDSWRVGAMAGYSHTKSDVRDIGGSNKSDNYHVGVYGGRQWDAVGVRLGAAHSWHHMRTNRSVAMPGLSEELTASPKARTTQIFADVGYNVDAGVMQLEPFVNLAYVNLHSQRFSEKGGAAALTSSSQNNDSTFMTVGSRLSADIDVGETQMTVSASAGWRHAFGSVLPKATQRFSSGEAFTITGVPLSRDSAVLEAGVAMQISRSMSVGVSYQGQLGSDAKDHGVRANVGIEF